MQPSWLHNNGLNGASREGGFSVSFAGFMAVGIGPPPYKWRGSEGISCDDRVNRIMSLHYVGVLRGLGA
jgi:hypothetical protein